MNVPTALPLSMKPDTANHAAQKSTRVQRNGSAPYANKNYIMKGADSCGSESGNELAGAMRLRPEGNETHKGLSPLRHPDCGMRLLTKTLYDCYRERHLCCDRCGTVLTADARFCPHCGQSLYLKISAD